MSAEYTARNVGQYVGRKIGLPEGGGAATPWTPATLFGSGEYGGYWNFSDKSTLWQDTAGTTPVASSGQSVSRADDLSGNANHVTAGGAPLYTEASGLSFADFNGSTHYLAKSAFTRPSNFTIAAAFRPASFAGNHAICCAGNGGNADMWAALVANAAAKAYWTYGDGTNYRDGTSDNVLFSSGLDVTFVQTYASGVIKPVLYINGTEVPSTTGGGTATTCAGTAQTFSIGKLGSFAGWYFPGRVYSVVKIDRVVTGPELSDLNSFLSGLYTL